jgi:hypothetical protein
MMHFARGVILCRPTTRRGLIHQVRYLASQFNDLVGCEQGCMYLPDHIGDTQPQNRRPRIGLCGRAYVGTAGETKEGLLSRMAWREPGWLAHLVDLGDRAGAEQPESGTASGWPLMQDGSNDSDKKRGASVPRFSPFKPLRQPLPRSHDARGHKHELIAIRVQGRDRVQPGPWPKIRSLIVWCFLV